MQVDRTCFLRTQIWLSNIKKELVDNITFLFHNKFLSKTSWFLPMRGLVGPGWVLVGTPRVCRRPVGSFGEALLYPGTGVD